MSKAYNPWAHAHELGIAVDEGRLPRGWRGGYHHPTRRIILTPGMSHREARSTLAHEVQHAIAGDIPSPFGLIIQRQELLAERRAALRLIDASEYALAEQLRGGYLSAIAHELDVTLKVVRTWLDLQRMLVAT